MPLDKSGVEADSSLNLTHDLICTTVVVSSVDRRTTGDPRMYITAVIHDTPLVALIDTGGTHTCLPSTSWDLLQEMGFIVRPVNGSATVADGGTAEITGVVRITFTLGKFSTWTGDVYLLKRLNFPMLIGTNTLEALGSKLDFKNSKLSVITQQGAEVIDVIYLEKQNHHTSVCSTKLQNVSPLTFEDGQQINLGAEISNQSDEESITRETYEIEDPVPPTSFTFNCEEFTEYHHPKISTENNITFNKFIQDWKHTYKTSPGVTKVSECKIYVDPTIPPIKQRSLRLSLKDQQMAEAEIRKLLSLNIIEPSESEWCSPAFLVDKKGGNKRLVVNYKGLNAVARKNSAPLPRMDECLKILQKANFVSTLDLQQGFYQIPMSDDSKHYTAFCLPPSHFYQFKRMPFGLCNSPAIFQTMIEKVLRQLLFKTCFVYVDDILITSNTFEEHVKNLNEVFELLFNAGLAINWEKCKLLKSETEFLGFIVGSGIIQAAPSKLTAVKDFERPRNVKQLRSFLGMVGWFRSFIPQLTTKAACLNDLLKNDEPFVWTDQRDEAFHNLKNCLINPPVLTVADPKLPFEIHTDASDLGVGGVLIQRKDNHPYVIAFASRSLSKYEKQYSVTQKECLALLWAVEKWRHYIAGNGTTVCYTDHASLLWLANLKAPTGRLARWVCRLSEFDLRIIHKKGKFNSVPDCLSRAPAHLEAVDLNLPDFEKINDAWFLDLRQRIIDNPDAFPAFKVQRPHVIKYMKNSVTGEVEPRHVIPQDFREILLQQNHNTLSAGHQGVNKTFHRLAEKYYWPKMLQDVKRFVRSCQICQQYKTMNVAPSGQMAIRDPCVKPFSMVCADLAGPLPMSGNQFRFILVIVDLATKFVIAKPLRNATASSIVQIFQHHLTLLHGCPEVIITDNGSQFAGHQFKDYCSSIYAKLHLIPRHFPSANPCERYIKSLKTMLATFANNDHKRWAEDLPHLVLALNTSRSETTHFSPARLVYGRDLRSPFELSADVQNGTSGPFDPSKYDGELQGSLKKTFIYVKAAMEKAQKTQAKVYNLRRRQNQEFPVGTLVWRQNFPQSDAGTRVTAKFSPKYIGPFQVTQVWSPTQVELADLSGTDKGRWHISHLKKFIGPDDDRPQPVDINDSEDGN